VMGGKRRFLFTIVDRSIRSAINVLSGVRCRPSSTPIEELKPHPIVGKPPVGIEAIKAVEGTRRRTERHLMESLEFMMSLSSVARLLTQPSLNLIL